MAESSTDTKSRKPVHPFFATSTEGRETQMLRVTGKPGVDDLLKKTILNITHLADMGTSTIRSQRSSLLGSLDPDTVAPSLSTEAHHSRSSAPEEEYKHPTSFTASEPEAPLAPSAAIERYGTFLTQLEVAEIAGYREVYYLGLNAEKVRGDITLPNCGYDDDRRDYRITMGDHLAYRYEIQRVLGKGGFGKVVQCFDHKLRRQVAVKIVRNDRLALRQMTVETQVLATARDQQCRYVVRMLEHFRFRDHACIVFQMLGESLLDCMKQTGYKGLPLGIVKPAIRQLASALSDLKKCHIIHADLKPENVLFAPSRDVYLIDFGTSCFESGMIYVYLQSRFYRAPEVILGAPYSFPIDMWSLGCVAAELHTGRPLFPGETERDQLQWIISALGLPPLDLVQQAAKAKLYFTADFQPKEFTNSRGQVKQPSSLPLSRLIPHCDGTFLDFISCCLRWRPQDRLTPEQVESHPFLAETG